MPGPAAPAGLASALDAALEKAVGGPRKLRHMAGVGAGGAWLCEGPLGSVVAKHPADAVERAVYRRAAATLRAGGVRVPACLDADGPDGDGWLVLEFLARAAPWDAAGSGGEALAQLATLHRLAWRGRLEGLPDGFAFVWTSPMSVEAAAAFGPGRRDALAQRLEAMRAAAGHLFRPVCAVHGDPNVTNWRIGADGLPVLIDWERAGYAHPAVDLGIFVPGLADPTAAQTLAEAYLDLRPDLSRGRWRHLASSILLAKAWSCVEFLWNRRRAPDHPRVRAAVSVLVERLPPWLDGVGV